MAVVVVVVVGLGLVEEVGLGQLVLVLVSREDDTHTSMVCHISFCLILWSDFVIL